MNTDWTPESLLAFEQDILETFERGEIRAPVHLVQTGTELPLYAVGLDVDNQVSRDSNPGLRKTLRAAFPNSATPTK